VTRLATDHGMTVTDSEIVGLVPASALGPDDIDHLKLAGFDPDGRCWSGSWTPRRRERKRERSRNWCALTVEGFCDVLASDSPRRAGERLARSKEPPPRR
jgi:hypothetical protein